MVDTLRARGAFAADAATAAGLAAAKAVWWTVNGLAARTVVRPSVRDGFRPERVSAAAPSRQEVTRAWLEAFTKDAADIRSGLYPATERVAPPGRAVLRALDFLWDAVAVDRRRRARNGVEVRDAAESANFPAYYRQNFHYQSGGWFTRDSARRYEAQVEALFSGTAGAMRRRALSLLARALRTRDQRGLAIVDMACGSGAFLHDLTATFPRATVIGLDLSPAYLAQARSRAGVPGVEANVERLPFADGSLDALSCIYLFHELPPRIRPAVAAEFARVLRPGGVLAFADAVQAADRPNLERLLQVFPVFFHEPFYDSFQAEDLVQLFGEAGLVQDDEDMAFLTKARLFRKPG
jgi:ubiquinone/menaquinone biosynthesis C-methylase UbiE